jgi:ComF family protein
MPPIFAYGRYAGSLKQAIAALKYDHNPHLAHPLGRWMAQAWLASPQSHTPTVPIVVPVPMHPDKQKQRGFNQATLLAESFCAFARLPLKQNGLERSRETAAQFQLSAAAREQNLADAFSLSDRWLKQPPTGPLLLLDDIYTTGATARSIIQTLRRHGIRVSGLVVLAQAAMDKQSTKELA